jgi:hypothetical protein
VKGEQIFVPANTLTCDRSLEGKNINRVRVSLGEDSFFNQMIGASDRAEFVNLAHVEVCCVPQKRVLEQGFAPPAMPWEPPPRTILYDE